MCSYTCVCLCVCVCLTQAVKNQSEVAGMREAHLRDAVALCDFLSFIESEVSVWAA